MSLRASIQAALADIETASIATKPIPYLVATFVFVVLVYSLGSTPKSDAPLLNPRQPFELTDRRAKGVFYQNCRSLLRNWFESHPNEPAQLITDYGHVTVLPPSMANEIRSDPNLSFADFSADVSVPDTLFALLDVVIRKTDSGFSFSKPSTPALRRHYKGQRTISH